jgi:hypothetical protein
MGEMKKIYCCVITKGIMTGNGYKNMPINRTSAGTLKDLI